MPRRVRGAEIARHADTPRCLRRSCCPPPDVYRLMFMPAPREAAQT